MTTCKWSELKKVHPIQTIVIHAQERGKSQFKVNRARTAQKDARVEHQTGILGLCLLLKEEDIKEIVS